MLSGQQTRFTGVSALTEGVFATVTTLKLCLLDDVLTSGASFSAARNKLLKRFLGRRYQVYSGLRQRRTMTGDTGIAQSTTNAALVTEE